MGEKVRISGERARMAVDILMTVMLPLQMAYSLIGETYHEAEGVILFALFLAHHAMHANWRRNLSKGRYNAYRVFNTAVNIALSLIMIFLPLNGRYAETETRLVKVSRGRRFAVRRVRVRAPGNSGVYVPAFPIRVF